MGVHSSPEEVLERHIRALGPDFGRIYNALWIDLATLYTKWRHFRDLYGTKPSRIDLLNASAPGFFSMIQRVLWEDILLHLARLVDKETTAGKPNLTVRRLPSLVVDPELKGNLERLIVIAADDKARFATDWRNRRMAHRDLALALRDNSVPLEGASRLGTNQAIAAVADVLNAVEWHYFHATVGYDMAAGHFDAELLLHRLSAALKAERERRARLQDGTATGDDYGPWPEV